MTDWHTIESAPEGEKVWTKIDDQDGERNVQQLTRHGRMWYIGTNDGTAIYVYYTPTHWRTPQESASE